jgi:hypothetical protein
MFDSSIYILFVLSSARKRDSLLMIIFLNVSSTWSIVELNTRFEAWITRNDVNGVSFFHLSYLITPMAYLCSQWTPKVQIKYFTFDWSIYRLFVLNRTCKGDSLQIIIFVYICSILGIGEPKTRFHTWITKSNVNCVSLFHLSYLITLMAYLCFQRTQNIQVNYFMNDSSIYILFD